MKITICITLVHLHVLEAVMILIIVGSHPTQGNNAFAIKVIYFKHPRSDDSFQRVIGVERDEKLNFGNGEF